MDATIRQPDDAHQGATARRPLSWTKRIGFSLTPAALLLVLAETLARLLVPDSPRFAQIEQIIVFLGNQPGESIFEPDPECFWRLRPHTVLPAENGPAWSGLMANSHGLRNREISVAQTEQQFRVLCLGDSSTFGFGVSMEESWPNLLHELLDGEQPQTTVVLNAGVPGQTTFQGQYRLRRELKTWRPHMAFITFGNNDGWRWDGLSDREHAERNRATPRFALLNASRAWQWISTWRQAGAASPPVEQAWAEQATWNYLDPQESWTPRVSLNDFAEHLRSMIAECESHGCQPVLVVWPDQRQLLGQSTWRTPYQVATRIIAQETGVECLDLVPRFSHAGAWGVARFLPQDVIHIDRAGNQMVSEAAAELVRPRLLAAQSGAGQAN